MTGSGVFLIVWAKELVEYLRATKGGYPHITVFYSGNELDAIQLSTIAFEVFAETLDLLPVMLYPSNVCVNSFFEEKTQQQRFDVLINLDEYTATFVESIRRITVAKHVTADQYKQFSMRKPHITHSIHYDEQSAQSTADAFKLLLPTPMNITGVTID